jgi:hypothetical protein
MKTVRNLTPRPIKIVLHGGHVLHLGPNKTGQVADGDAERPSFRRMIERGEVELLEDAATEEAPAASRGGQATNSGYSQRKVVLPSGGRTAGGRRES